MKVHTYVPNTSLVRLISIMQNPKYLAEKKYWLNNPGANQGFPVGRRRPILGEGRGPLMQALFGENVCKNERIGCRRGACAGKFCM